MSEAKEDMLQKIRKALDGVPEHESPEDVQVPRAYRREGELSSDEIVELFVERVGEYKATVKKVEKQELPKQIEESCRRQKAEKMAIPPGFPGDWLPDSLTVVNDEPETPLSHPQLDAVHGVITTCALAVAQTGTIILDAGAGQGRRALTLLPDYHLCIVESKQIVELIPEGFAKIEPQVKKEGRPITFISGPSATSDIELSRVEGVHGPRRLEILIC